MSSGLEQLLLKTSKGTIVEGLARDVVRRRFQDVPSQLQSDNKGTTIFFIVMLLLISFVLVYVLPLYIHSWFMNEFERDKSVGLAVVIMELFFFSTYLVYVGPTVLAMLIIALVLIISLF